MKEILFFGFFTFLILGIDYYAFQAIKHVFSAKNIKDKTVKLIYWIFTMFLLATIVFMATVGFEHTPPLLKKMAAMVFFFGFTAKFFAIFWLFGEDIIRLSVFALKKVFRKADVELADRRKFISRLSFASALLPLGVLSYGVVKNAYNFKFYHERIKLANLPDNFKGLKIVQLSDIHAGTFGQTEPILDVVEKINALKPDLIFFTGDLVNDLASEMDDYKGIFSQMKAKHGVYSVLGNHDYGDYAFGAEASTAKSENFWDFIKLHEEMGWKLLRNENTRIEIDGQSIGLIGVENYSERGRFVSHGDLTKAYKGIENEPVKILLSHDPSHWDAVVNKDFKDIGLTLSGHTHGFQFGIETKWLKWSPSQYPYKQWAGLYQTGEQQIYVNRGFGNLGYPGRVGILPEVSVIELA